MTLIELRAWTLLIAGIAYWGNAVRAARHAGGGGLAYVLDGVVQNGAFTAAAWVLIAVWVAGAAAPRRACGKDLAGAAALGLLAAVPSRQAAILVLVVLGLQIARPTGTRTGRRVAALLFALALDAAWTSPYALPLHAAVADLDARVVQGLLHLGGIAAAGAGNLVIGASGGGIEILARCASSYPFGGICLAYVVTSLYLERFPGKRDLPWLAASLAASVVLTELRLSCMVWRVADFTWLHDGGGGTVYVLAATALAVLFPLLAAREARPAYATP